MFLYSNTTDSNEWIPISLSSRSTNVFYWPIHLNQVCLEQGLMYSMQGSGPWGPELGTSATVELVVVLYLACSSSESAGGNQWCTLTLALRLNVFGYFSWLDVSHLLRWFLNIWETHFNNIYRKDYYDIWQTQVPLNWTYVYFKIFPFA